VAAGVSLEPRSWKWVGYLCVPAAAPVSAGVRRMRPDLADAVRPGCYPLGNDMAVFVYVPFLVLGVCLGATVRQAWQRSSSRSFRRAPR